jgi:hypothetical protein
MYRSSEIHVVWTADLSHLSLLFLHGSQLMAFRARLVGGRPSPFCSPAPGGGEILVRTVPAAEGLAFLDLGPVGEDEVWSSGMLLLI